MTEYKYYTNESIKATTGLVSAYNMIPSNGTLVDISGNQNHGTINGAISTKDGLKFDGVDDSVSIGDIGNIKSIAMRVKLNSTSEKMLEGQANDKLIYTNAGTLTYSDYDNAYVNGVDTDTIVAGQWIDIVIISSTDVDNSTLTLALNNTTYGNLEIADIRFYNKELSVAEIKDYHNSFIKPYLLEDMSNHPVGETSPKGWVKRTGSYEVKEFASQDYVLKDLDTGTKYLENTSAGTAAIQSKQAYGEWEFSVYKGADGNNVSVPFIHSEKSSAASGNNYEIRLNTDERLVLNKDDSNVSYTATNYISNNTWYRLKVARLQSEGTFASIVSSMTTTYPADTFAVFIKGGEFGDEYTLVDTTGGSGSNPVTDSTYTTSEFVVLDLDSGDKFTNLKIYDGVKQ